MKKIIALPAFLLVLLVSCSSLHKAGNLPQPSTQDLTVRGFSYSLFQSFTSDQSCIKFQPELWRLWKKENWDSLTIVVNTNKINWGYPPANGFIGVDTLTLAAGTKLDRYGYNGGAFVAPLGTPFTERALQDSVRFTKPYCQFVVIAPIHGVYAGKAIPWFKQEGMGMQYMFNVPIDTLISKHLLKVIECKQPSKSAKLKKTFNQSGTSVNRKMPAKEGGNKAVYSMLLRLCSKVVIAA
jgi:hypothetical protein